MNRKDARKIAEYDPIVIHIEDIKAFVEILEVGMTTKDVEAKIYKYFNFAKNTNK